MPPPAPPEARAPSGRTPVAVPRRECEPRWSYYLGSHRHLTGFVVVSGMAILGHAELTNHDEVATQVAALIGGALAALAYRRRGETVARLTREGEGGSR